MKKILQCLTAMCVVIGLSSSASAISVMSGTLGPTAFGGQEISSGSIAADAATLPLTGTLTVTATGDVDDLFGESVDVFLNNTLIGTFGRGIGTTAFSGGNTIMETFSVSSVLLASIAGSTVDFKFDGAANVGSGTEYSGTLSYASVPEPASLALLAIGGLVGGGAYRRRRAVAA